MYGRSSWLLGALAVAAPAIGWAQDEGKTKKEPEKKQAQEPAIERWIQQLGSQEFKEREEAANKLRDAGDSALPQLRETMKSSDDAEVRWQARKLVREIERGIGSGRGLKPLQREEKAEKGEPPRVWGFDPRGFGLDDRFDQMFRDLERDFGITVPRGRFFQEDFFKDLQQQLKGMDWKEFQGEGHAFSMKIGPDGVRVEVKEKDKDGKEKSQVYEAPDMESFREKYPEIAKKYMDGGQGGFSLRLGDPNNQWFQFGNPDVFTIRPDRGGARLWKRDGTAPRVLRPMDEPQPAEEVPEGERLGVYVAADISPDLREHLELDEGVGLRVESIMDGSLAEALGIKKGDILISINDKSIGGASDIRAVLKDLSEKDEVRIELARKGKKTTVKGTKGSKVR